MQDHNRKESGTRLPYVLFALGVFAFLLVFFFAYRPVMLDNMDDWTYISFTRSAVPKWNYWNPSRVLPEILMPFCAQLGVWFVLPFVGDYVLSVTYALNFALCLLITLYICAAACLLKKLMKTSAAMTVLLGTLYLILHFRSWMSPWIPSQHLFYSGCVTTCYYYTVPALINIAFVLLIESFRNGRGFWRDERLIAKGFLIAGLYLAVFSNLFASVILAVYAGCSILEHAARAIARKERFGGVLRESALHIGVLLMWLVSAVFELSGGRARSMDSEVSLIDRVKDTVSELLITVERMEDTTFWLCTALIVVGFVVALFFGKKGEEESTYLTLLVRHLFCAGVTLACLIVLSAASEPVYIARMDVLLGVMFHILLAAMLSLAYLLQRWKKLVLLVPLAAFIMGFEVLYHIDSFAHSTPWQIPEKTCIQTNQTFMRQIMDAEEKKLESVTIKVPMGDPQLFNWPYTTNMGGRMISTLRNQGVIEHLRHIYIDPDPDFYQLFEIDR